MYYGQENDPDYITHFGVKGMKWGVRRSKKSDDIEGVGAGGDVNEDEEERKRKQKELQELAAAIIEKGEEIGMKVDKSIYKTLQNIKNDRFVEALSKVAKQSTKNFKNGANDIRRHVGILTYSERKAKEKREEDRLRKKFGVTRVRVDKKTVF